MTTAQEVYKVMLKEHLSPGLRGLGFKGSAGAYELPSETHWMVLGVQASAYSSADGMTFTLNCQVVSHSTWDAMRAERGYLGAKPKPNTVAGSFVWWSRIGELLPEGEDKWWSLRPGDDPAPIAREVLQAVRDFALPAMRSAASSNEE